MSATEERRAKILGSIEAIGRKVLKKDGRGAGAQLVRDLAFDEALAIYVLNDPVLMDAAIGRVAGISSNSKNLNTFLEMALFLRRVDTNVDGTTKLVALLNAITGKVSAGHVGSVGLHTIRSGGKGGKTAFVWDGPEPSYVQGVYSIGGEEIRIDKNALLRIVRNGFVYTYYDSGDSGYIRDLNYAMASCEKTTTWWGAALRFCTKAKDWMFFTEFLEKLVPFMQDGSGKNTHRRDLGLFWKPGSPARDMLYESFIVGVDEPLWGSTSWNRHIARKVTFDVDVGSASRIFWVLILSLDDYSLVQFLTFFLEQMNSNRSNPLYEYLLRVKMLIPESKILTNIISAVAAPVNGNYSHVRLNSLYLVMSAAALGSIPLIEECENTSEREQEQDEEDEEEKEAGISNHSSFEEEGEWETSSEDDDADFDGFCKDDFAFIESADLWTDAVHILKKTPESFRNVNVYGKSVDLLAPRRMAWMARELFGYVGTLYSTYPESSYKLERSGDEESEWTVVIKDSFGKGVEATLSGFNLVKTRPDYKLYIGVYGRAHVMNGGVLKLMKPCGLAYTMMRVLDYMGNTSVLAEVFVIAEEAYPGWLGSVAKFDTMETEYSGMGLRPMSVVGYIAANGDLPDWKRLRTAHADFLQGVLSGDVEAPLLIVAERSIQNDDGLMFVASIIFDIATVPQRMADFMRRGGKHVLESLHRIMEEKGKGRLVGFSGPKGSNDYAQAIAKWYNDELAKDENIQETIINDWAIVEEEDSNLFVTERGQDDENDEFDFGESGREVDALGRLQDAEEYMMKTAGAMENFFISVGFRGKILTRAMNVMDRYMTKDVVQSNMAAIQLVHDTRDLAIKRNRARRLKKREQARAEEPLGIVTTPVFAEKPPVKRQSTKSHVPWVKSTHRERASTFPLEYVSYF